MQPFMQGQPMPMQGQPVAMPQGMMMMMQPPQIMVAPPVAPPAAHDPREEKALSNNTAVLMGLPKTRLFDILEACSAELDTTAAGDLPEKSLAVAIWCVSKLKPNLKLCYLRCKSYGDMYQKVRDAAARVKNALSAQGYEALIGNLNNALDSEEKTWAFACERGFQMEWAAKSKPSKAKPPAPSPAEQFFMAHWSSTSSVRAPGLPMLPGIPLVQEVPPQAAGITILPPTVPPQTAGITMLPVRPKALVVSGPQIEELDDFDDDAFTTPPREPLRRSKARAPKPAPPSVASPKPSMPKQSVSPTLASQGGSGGGSPISPTPTQPQSLHADNTTSGSPVGTAPLPSRTSPMVPLAMQPEPPPSPSMTSPMVPLSMQSAPFASTTEAGGTDATVRELTEDQALRIVENRQAALERKRKRESGGGDNPVCEICKEVMGKDQEITTLECMHCFHGDCIKLWAASKGARIQDSCPYKCRIDKAALEAIVVEEGSSSSSSSAVVENEGMVDSAAIGQALGEAVSSADNLF